VNVLVDTSVWSLALRRASRNLNSQERRIVEELKELINDGRARVVGIVRQEVLSGIKSQDQFLKLREVLRAFPDESLSISDYEHAAEIGNRCRSRGLAVSAVDMLLCAVAHSRDWAIFSTDPDFKRYASVISFPLHSPR
jgi:predicted nucleic acid-binding protein